MTEAERGEAQAKFLALFSETANITLSCKAAGVARSTMYVWLEKDVEFDFLYHQAEKAADDALEAEALRRAVEGVERRIPHFYEGEVCGETIRTEYSDTLLIFLMKGRMPDKYRENITVRQEDHITPPVKEALRELAAAAEG